MARNGRPTGYVIQAAIAALHSGAQSAADTDWSQIASLYSLLARLDPSPVTGLNRAVAIAMSEGIEQGLSLLEKMNVPGYHLLPAARADLLRRLQRRTEAAAAYREALALVKMEAERRFLKRRLADVSSSQPSGAYPATDDDSRIESRERGPSNGKPARLSHQLLAEFVYAGRRRDCDVSRSSLSLAFEPKSKIDEIGPKLLQLFDQNIRVKRIHQH
ncbi:MAG: hypothetical protein ABIV50_10440 [Opitutus sp.]